MVDGSVTKGRTVAPSTTTTARCRVEPKVMKGGSGNLGGISAAAGATGAPYGRVEFMSDRGWVAVILGRRHDAVFAVAGRERR
jgi:hypothetical protein